jgi:carbon monoxide dehydrogenase subunit G
MIETEQSASVNARLEDVWTYVRDIERWASIMPGYRECEILNADDSRWTLKVGVGGLVRTVRVAVRVEAWNGPGEARFRYKLEGDPVEGAGIYSARSTGADQTEITLKVHVEGSGPMAPMWEAMGKPLLPQFAKSFAEQLKAKIEAHLPGQAPPPRWSASMFAWFHKLWASAFGGPQGRRQA